ncbi:MAG: adenylate/guanylate cyclase domain-containing protein [Bacteroidota bacterium]
MDLKNKRKWRIIKDYAIGWTLAFIFLAIVRGIGTTEAGYLKFDFFSSLIIATTIGPILGSISGYAQLVTEERVYKRMSIQRLLILRFTFVLLFLGLLILVAYIVYQLYFGTDIGLVPFALDKGSSAIYFYVLSVDIFMLILRQVNLMLGEKNLSKLLTGKFYTPREEERIFMFLDLQSSTQLAEKLGHIRYSMLIQDCFNDLGVVAENEAEIYQYVGDEVILTWGQEDGIKHQNCIHAFFNFKQQLIKKGTYYQQKYNCQPFFKAGMNAGTVTVTEVGKYKKEIAYHGDTINTAARIQGKCNDFGKEILISEFLKNKLDLRGFQIEKLGNIPLKGKTKEVPVYAVSREKSFQN